MKSLRLGRTIGPIPVKIAGVLFAALLLISASLAISREQASAQTVYTQYFSLSCEFWGEANVTYSQSLAKASTSRTTRALTTPPSATTTTWLASGTEPTITGAIPATSTHA